MPDEGEILLDGEVIDIEGPSDAIARGINMVHQHFMLVPVLSVADNILLGEETMRGPIFIDKRESKKRITELGQRFGFDIIYVPEINRRIDPVVFGNQQLHPGESFCIREETFR